MLSITSYRIMQYVVFSLKVVDVLKKFRHWLGGESEVLTTITEHRRRNTQVLDSSSSLP